MASCAVCRHPIARRADVCVQDTEVIHRGCAGGATVRQKLEHELAESMRTAEQLTRAALLAQELAASRLRQLSSAVAGRAADNTDNAREQRELLRRARDAESTARRMEAERDAARRELALYQATAAPQPQPERDERDASEVRFSLLEIDRS
jgi:CRISPR/Cas system-associated endonuclease Cas1